MKTTTEIKSKRKLTNWAITGVLLSWLTFWFLGLAFFGLIAWIVILIYLMVKKSSVKWYLILSAWLFVPGCNFMQGTANYLNGTATIKNIGGPPGNYGVDSDTRAPLQFGTCIFIGYEIFVFPSYNAAVRLWTNMLGYQKGSYMGPMPDKNQAYTWLMLADTLVAREKGDQFEITIDGETMGFNAAQYYYNRLGYSSLDTLLGIRFEEEGFMFRPIGGEPVEKEGAFLFNTQNGSLQAIYYFD